MNAFDSCRGVEAQANALLLPYLEEKANCLALSNKSTLAIWLQESVGDVILSTKDEQILFSVELKAEKKHTGNIFLETWSNKNLANRKSHAERGQNVGWLMKIRADLLLYYFIDVDMLYAFDVFSLKRWVFGDEKSAGKWSTGQLQERRQSKHSQMNDTWGVLASLVHLHEELPPRAMKTTKVRQRTIEGMDPVTFKARTALELSG